MLRHGSPAFLFALSLAAGIPAAPARACTAYVELTYFGRDAPKLWNVEFLVSTTEREVAGSFEYDALITAGGGKVRRYRRHEVWFPRPGFQFTLKRQLGLIEGEELAGVEMIGSLTECHGNRQ